MSEELIERALDAELARLRLIDAAKRMLKFRGDQDDPHVHVSARDIIAVLSRPEAGPEPTYSCSASYCDGFGPWRILARYGNCAWVKAIDDEIYRSVEIMDLTEIPPT